MPTGSSRHPTRIKVATDRLLRRSSKFFPRWPVPRLAAPVVGCCIYREKNAAFVSRMIGQLPPQTDVRLHALGDVTPELSQATLSQGPGMRTPLLQSLLDHAPIPAEAWVIIFDDDADFSKSGRSDFLDIAAAARLDIAGAAIDIGQARTYAFTLIGRVSVARTVRMVEIGPVLAFSPLGFARVMPFPAEAAMGWGLDIRWSQIPDVRRGYVDATPVRHHGPVGEAYETERELSQVSTELRMAGLSSMGELSESLSTWRPWQRVAPWL